MSFSNKVTFAVVGLMFAPSAFAYLDPGTGSMIIQGVIAGIAMASIAAKTYWYKIKGFLGMSQDTPEDDSSSTD